MKQQDGHVQGSGGVLGGRVSRRDFLRMGALTGDDPKLNPVPNVCTSPITGGQWVKGEKYPYDLIVVDNSQAPEVPTQGALEPIQY